MVELAGLFTKSGTSSWLDLWVSGPTPLQFCSDVEILSSSVLSRKCPSDCTAVLVIAMENDRNQSC